MHVTLLCTETKIRINACGQITGSVVILRMISSIVFYIQDSQSSIFQVAMQLIGEYSTRSRAARRSDSISMTGAFAIQHTPTTFDGRPRICRQCKKEGKKTAKGRVPETKHGCHQCKVNLHRCFYKFLYLHTIRITFPL